MRQNKILNLPNIAILIGHLIFIYVWGFSGWQSADLFSESWWFDTRGHFIFGMKWGWIWLYFIKTYRPATYIIVPKLDTVSIIIARVIIMATLWEGIELLWDLKIQPDFASWLAKAQKDSADTTLDIIITTSGAVIDMPLWWIYRKYYEWRWPNETIEEALEETIERIKLSAEEIRLMQKEHRRKVLTKTKLFWEKLWDNLLDKEK